MTLDVTLNAIEVRVLGSLIEKQITTPEYYPLSLNALVNACNQKSNRDPVVAFDDVTVARAIETLREKGFGRMVTGGDNRVPKYKQIADQVLNLASDQLAALCVLMLRGPQTAGEIRSRSGSLYRFEDLAAVEWTLGTLINREPLPLVIQLPRQAGFKESRFAHLLAGEVSADEIPSASHAEPAVLKVRAENDRVAALEGAVRQLREEVEALKQQFVEFKKQFE